MYFLIVVGDLPSSLAIALIDCFSLYSLARVASSILIVFDALILSPFLEDSREFLIVYIFTQCHVGLCDYMHNIMVTP